MAVLVPTVDADEGVGALVDPEPVRCATHRIDIFNVDFEFQQESGSKKL